MQAKREINHIEMASSSILTGQYVHIKQTPASIGERILAQIIDWVAQAVYSFGLTYLYVSYLDDLLRFSTALQVIFVFGVILLPTLFYGFLCELFANGQTLGKRIMKIRVVKTDGSSPGIGAYLMRWMFMIIDGPAMSGLGVLIMIFNKDNRRIGDLAAGTLVIKLGGYQKLQVTLDEFAPFSRNYRPVYPAAEDLTLEQVNLIDQTLRLKDEDPRIHALAEQVQQTLAIAHVHDSDDKTFLWHIKRDYQYYALEEI